MSRIVPHYFQTDAKNAIFEFLVSGEPGNPLVCMPTASGKSVVISDFVMDVFKYFPQKRVMMLTHVSKLISQNAERLLQMWPEAPLGIHSDGLDRRDTFLPIIYGGIQSVCPTMEKSPQIFGKIDALMIDEAHLVGDVESSQYLKVIGMLQAANPDMRIIGFTATWYRLKMGLLTDGGIFTKVIYNICTREWFERLIKEGHLNPLIGKPTNTKIDGIRDIGMVGGEFNQKKADELIDRGEIIEASCREVLEFGWDRHKMMGFASGVKSAEHLAEMFCMLGANVTCVHSKISKKENQRRLEAYSAGEYWGIVGANMLTTGYDEPQIDLICDWQVTTSPAKHVQKLGRGTRVLRNWERYRPMAKPNTLVLDFVGNIANLGPIDDPVMPRKPGEKTGDPPPVKICDAPKLKENEGKGVADWIQGCGAYNHASVRLCCNCSAEFSFKLHVESTASYASPMKQDEAPVLQSLRLMGPVFYSRHEGKEKSGFMSPPMVKAVYPVGTKSINVFLGFEHTGYPRHKAHEWWRMHSSSKDIPQTVDEFLQRTGETRLPKSVLAQTNLKYWEIKQYEF